MLILAYIRVLRKRTTQTSYLSVHIVVTLMKVGHKGTGRGLTGTCECKWEELGH